MTRAALIAAASSQWVRTPVARVVLDLPLPISTNARLKTAGKTMRPTKAYREWKAEAGASLLIQRPGRVPGRYHLRLEVCRTWGGDLSNSVKTVEDLLQAHGCIDNDRLAETITLAWADVLGTRVTITSTASLTGGPNADPA